MAKKQLYFAEAERLYVQEQYTLNEIALHLHLAEKTIRTWKDEGNWDIRRKQYLAEKQNLHEELYLMCRYLSKSINEDLKAGNKVDAGRLYTLVRILPILGKTKDIEEILKTDKGEPAGTKTLAEMVTEFEAEAIR